MHHEKKIQKKYYDFIRNHLKMFEIRKEDDTLYHEGDTISFKDIDGKSLQGKWLITYILRHEDFPEGIQPGYAILSLINI